MTATFVLMAGLPGTGKSTLAAALAGAVHGVVLSKDVIREALFPAALIDYTEQQDDLCVHALLTAASYIAAHAPVEHYYIFLDGRTYRKRSQIETAMRAAEEAHCRWRILLLTCPEDVAINRITRDSQSGGHLARNRDRRLYLESRERFEPIDYPCLCVDTSLPLEACVELCLPYLVQELAQPVKAN